MAQRKFERVGALYVPQRGPLIIVPKHRPRSIPYAAISGPVHQAVGGWTSGSSFVVTITAPAAGNFLVCTVAINPNTRFVASISGGGVTWGGAADARNTNATQAYTSEIWSGVNSSGSGTSITINLSATPTRACVNISEWAGVALTSPFDVGAGTTNGTSTSPATDSITTLNANDLIIAALTLSTTGTHSAGPTNSFTELTDTTNGSTVGLFSAYRLVSATALYSTGWTISAGQKWVTTIASYKAAAATGPNPDSWHPLIEQPLFDRKGVVFY